MCPGNRIIDAAGKERAARGRYTVRKDDAVVFRSDGKPADRLSCEFHERFRAHVLGAGFPCIGARRAVVHGTYGTAIYRELGAPDCARELFEDLRAFAGDLSVSPDPFMTYAAMFQNPHPGSEAEFEALLWKHLQAVHEIDREHFAWDSRVDSSPESPSFSFSVAGIAFFVVGLSPASRRKGRWFPFPTMVFNAHHQFEALRAIGLYQKMQVIIRERDKACSGSINPNLSDFGEQSEARQYSGRYVSGNWKCPLEIGK